MNRDRNKVIDGGINLPNTELNRQYNRAYTNEDFFVSADFLKFENTNELNYVYFEFSKFEEISFFFNILKYR